jgi:hypothetical protein
MTGRSDPKRRDYPKHESASERLGAGQREGKSMDFDPIPSFSASQHIDVLFLQVYSSSGNVRIDSIGERRLLRLASRGMAKSHSTSV